MDVKYICPFPQPGWGRSIKLK